MCEQNIPLGLCGCGCGRKTTVPAKTSTKDGRFKGQPMRFVHGHNARVRWGALTNYVVDAESGCWIWQRAKNPQGYGLTLVDGKPRLAHRAVYEKHRGPIPSGAHGLDHLCRNTLCVNPDHLQPVTTALNCRRGSKTKLDWDKVHEIRRSTLSHRALAREYGVAPSTITNIRKGRRWVEGLERSW